MIKELYRKLFPKKIRNIMWQIIHFIPNEIKYHKSYNLKRKIISYLKSHITEENSPVLDFLQHTNSYYFVFPYDFPKKYDEMEIDIQYENGFPFVLRNGKKLFGKKNMTEKNFREMYKGLLKEQDADSPHRYLTNGRYPKQDSIIADIGAAEGIFALDVIDFAKKIYLFECEPDWIEALKMTFRPYENKIEIINKYVSSHDDETHNTISLDTFFRDKEVNYIKADIEGAEEDMLAGGKNVFSTKITQTLLCCYHKKDAEEHFRHYLKDNGFSNIDVNSGYLIWQSQEETLGIPLEAPYLRHGVMYADKSN